MSSKRVEVVAVACRNGNGESDIVVLTVLVSKSGYIDGEHYDLAKEKAKEEGYEGPFVCFDADEHANILRVVPALTQ